MLNKVIDAQRLKLFCFVILALGLLWVSRWLAPLPNFTALGALIVFAPLVLSQFFSSRSAQGRSEKLFAVTLLWVGMLVSDVFIGFYPQMLWVYLTIGALLLLGLHIERLSKVRWQFGFCLFQASIFFITTNFAVWATTNWYAKSLSGLVECYTLALPFFKNQLVGDLFYTCIFSGVFLIVQARAASKSEPLHQ